MSVVVGWLFGMGVGWGSTRGWGCACSCYAMIFANVAACGGAFRGRTVTGGRIGGRT